MNETSIERLARLLALVPWLRANDGVTIEQAAQHFAVSPEQLTTDLWQLIVCGIPGYGPDQLVDIQFWDDDRIHVLDPIALAQPLRLNGEEAAALLVAMRILTQVPGTHDREALRTAMAKVQGAVDSDDIGIDMPKAADDTVAETITAALSEHGSVHIEYAPGDRDTVSQRRIDPRASYVVDGRVYLEAYCHLANDIRTFRLDRVLSAEPAGPAHAAAEREGEGVEVSVERPKPSTVTSARIAVDPAAAWVWDTEPVRPDGQIWQDRGWPTGTIEYASLGWLVRFVLGHAGGVCVLDPPEAKTAVARRAETLLAGMRDD